MLSNIENLYVSSIPQGKVGQRSSLLEQPATKKTSGLGGAKSANAQPRKALGNITNTATRKPLGEITNKASGPQKPVTKKPAIKAPQQTTQTLQTPLLAKQVAKDVPQKELMNNKHKAPLSPFLPMLNFDVSAFSTPIMSSIPMVSEYRRCSSPDDMFKELLSSSAIEDVLLYSIDDEELPIIVPEVDTDITVMP